VRLPIVLAALSLSVQACAPQVGGRLVDPVGQPVAVPEARVNLVPLEGDAPSTAEILVPDGLGKFESKMRLNRGVYLVEALVPGYKSQSVKVTSDDCRNIVLKLEPLSKITTSTFRTFNNVSPDQGAGGASITPPQL
jgi:hypothetical protein